MAIEQSAEFQAQRNREALDFYLGEFQGGMGPHSSLESVLRDARTTMEQGEALWLAALGYLVATEALGRTVRRVESQFMKRAKPGECFRAGLLEFGDGSLTDEHQEALWSFRGGLAHHYELVNVQQGGRRIDTFSVRRTGQVVLTPMESGEFTVWVNVKGLGEHVERTVANARAEHGLGNVELVRPADEVHRGGFVISNPWGEPRR